MSVSVGAVVVSTGDLVSLELTLSALRAQLTKVHQTVVVFTEKTDELEAWASRQDISAVYQVEPYKSQVEAGIQSFNQWSNDSEHFVWLLGDFTFPEPTALSELLRAVERAPSVAVLSPKLLDAKNPRFLHEVGQTLTPWGGIFSSAKGQLDQAQFDADGDTLAVSADAALVRSDVWILLDGFDQRLSDPTQAFDFSMRARLAGYRVEVVPSARVLVEPKEPLSPSARRAAELELKAAFAPRLLLPLLWVALPLWGLLRAVYQIATKRLELVAVEIGVAARFFFTPWRLFAINRNPSRKEQKEMRRLRASWSEVLSRRRESSQKMAPTAPETSQANLLWWLLILVALNLGFWPSGAAAVGGALQPLSATWLQVFSHAGSSWQNSGFGAAIPADPVNWVIAAISAVTFWQPNLAISLFILFARALAFLGAEKLFGRVVGKPWLARLLAAIFTFWPAFTNALLNGNFSAVITLVAAPWLVNSLLSALDESKTRTAWLTQVGVAGLLLSAALAASPSTAPLWIVFVAALAVAKIKQSRRLLWAAIPTLVIFGPYLLFQSVGANQPFLVLVDPLSTEAKSLTLWQSFLGGSVTFAKDFWQIDSGWPLLTVGVCLLLMVVALGSVKTRLVLALAAAWVFASTWGWLLTHISVTTGQSSQNPSAAFGLAGLAILALIGIAFDQIKSKRAFALTAVSLVLLPLVVTAVASSNRVRHTEGQILPAIVEAEWNQGNRLKVLQLTGTSPVMAQLVTPESLSLDGQSLGYRLSIASRSKSKDVEKLSVIAANLVAASSTDLTSKLRDLRVGFVFAPSPSGTLIAALDSSAQLEAVGVTKLGRLWRVADAASGAPVAEQDPRNFWSVTKGIQLATITIFALMALPTGGRARRRRDSDIDEGDPIDVA